MIGVLRKLVAPLSVALLIAIAVPCLAVAQSGGDDEDGRCMSNRQTQAAIASGDVPPVSEVLRMEGINPDDVLSVRLCEGREGLTYVVGLLDEAGEARTLVLPATF